MTINQPGIKVLPFHLAVKLMDLVRKKKYRNSDFFTCLTIKLNLRDYL